MTTTPTNQKIIDNHLKAPRKFFDWAFGKFPIYEWSNKERNIQSSERKTFSECIHKRLTKNTSFNFYANRDYFIWLGATSKRIEIQTYRITQYIAEGKEKFDIKLYNFEQFSNDKHIKLGYKSGEYFNGLSMLGIFKGPYSDCWVYNEDLFIQRLQSVSELKYVDLNTIFARRYSSVIGELPHIYKYRNILEYVQKIGARGLQKDILGDCYYGVAYNYQHADMRRLTFNFVKKHKSVFKNSDITFAEVRTKQTIEDKLGKCIDGFEKLFAEDDLDLLPSCVKPIRFQHWALREGVSAVDYRDYIRLVTAVGLEFKGDYLVIPKNFKQAHGEAVANYEAMNLVENNKEYASRLNDLVKLETTIGCYKFKVPKRLEELKQEGKSLHHCVGTYVKRQQQGETSIFFVRNIKAPDTPLYTLEMHKGKIIQFRADHNQQVPTEAWNAARAFLQFANKQNIYY